jgi:hypothetical protein
VIAGKYQFVYCSFNDVGIGWFEVNQDGKFMGGDYGGSVYRGTAKEDAKGCRIASESVADFRRITHLDTGIPLMGCVSTLPQSADSAARTNVSKHRRSGPSA